MKEIKELANKKKVKILNITHKRDLDGWASAAIVRHWFVNIRKKNYQDKLDVWMWDYGTPLPLDGNYENYDLIIITDLTMPKYVMEKYQDKMIWIDHHEMMFKNFSKDIRGLRNSIYAACELTWFYFFNTGTNPIPSTYDVDYDKETMHPEPIRLLGLYDSFRHKKLSYDDQLIVLNFQYAARSYITDPLSAYDWLFINEIDVADWNEKGQQIYDYVIVMGKNSINDLGYAVNIKGKYLLAINQERINPKTIGIDIHDTLGYQGVISYWYNGVKWNYSVYTDDGGFHAGEWCKKNFDGGGHEGAAGFVTDNLLPELLRPILKA